MEQKISWKNRLDYLLFGWLVNWVYPQYVRPKYNYIPYYKMVFQYVIPQKVLRINGNIPWPVHFTSKITSAENIKKGVLTDPGDNIGIYIQAKNGIIFGDNVGIGAGTVIISANHNAERHTDHDKTRPIKIGNNTFVYANSVVLPGVEIGDNVIIGAGSVVTKDIPSNTVAVGNPCRVIKEKPPYQESIYSTEWNRKNKYRENKLPT